MPPHAHDYDWRFTFSAAEADLFHYHRNKKALKLAYIALKFLIKLDTGNKGGPVGTFFLYGKRRKADKVPASLQCMQFSDALLCPHIPRVFALLIEKYRQVKLRHSKRTYTHI